MSGRVSYLRDGAALRPHSRRGYGDLLVLREIVGVFSRVSN